MLASALKTLLSLSLAHFALSDEAVVSVALWDSLGKVAEPGGNPPRFVIGNISLGGRSQRFTFDAGNPKEPILIVEGCLGCGNGCPSRVPQCSSSASPCWNSHPEDYAPAGSFEISGDSCPTGVKSAGKLDGMNICTQCFGGGHSRFYTMATADAAFSDKFILKQLKFGALVRTAPAIDRVWSNIGVGYKSSFLKQLGAGSIMFHLRAGSSSQVIFNPDASRFAGAASASFSVGINREHKVGHMQVGGGSVVDFGDAKFHIDTGNSGISIMDAALLSKLNTAAKGLVPSTAPNLTVVLDGIQVHIAGASWIRSDGSTIFEIYHKNVLGLPFVTAADIVFDDDARRIYIVGGVPGPPTPPPSPPAPSECVSSCQSSTGGTCDCQCFCSCKSICGNGCYDKCRSGRWVHASCKHTCKGWAHNSSIVV